MRSLDPNDFHVDHTKRMGLKGLPVRFMHGKRSVGVVDESRLTSDGWTEVNARIFTDTEAGRSTAKMIRDGIWGGLSLTHIYAKEEMPHKRGIVEGKLVVELSAAPESLINRPGCEIVEIMSENGGDLDARIQRMQKELDDAKKKNQELTDVKDKFAETLKDQKVQLDTYHDRESTQEQELRKRIATKLAYLKEQFDEESGPMLEGIENVPVGLEASEKQAEFVNAVYANMKRLESDPNRSARAQMFEAPSAAGKRKTPEDSPSSISGINGVSQMDLDLLAAMKMQQGRV